MRLHCRTCHRDIYLVPEQIEPRTTTSGHVLNAPMILSFTVTYHVELTAQPG